LGVAEREVGAFDDSGSPGTWMEPGWIGTIVSMVLQTLHTYGGFGRVTRSRIAALEDRRPGPDAVVQL
jgi:hypothetical protein